MNIFRRIAIAGLASAAVLVCTAVQAQGTDAVDSFPSKPVRLIIPFPTGGPTDGLARILADGLSKKWGRPVIADNRPSAGGNLGSQLTAAAAPDGYTLLFAANSHAINATLFKNLPYDAVKDFTAVSLVATYPLVLVVPASSPITSLRELVAAAKAKPGTLNYASASLGTPTHLAMELFKAAAGITAQHVPYKGAQAATIDLVAGRVDMMFNNSVSALPMVKAGKLRALAVSSRTRSKLLPEVSTVEELGFPGFEATTWYGILAPAGLSRPLLAKLEKDIIEVTRSAEVGQRFEAVMTDPVGNTSEQFSAILRTDVEKWEKIIRQADIRPE